MNTPARGGRWRRLAREPLLHFLLAGGLLYLLHALAGGGAAADADHQIVVDRPALLRYMQYQARAFEPSSFAATLDGMSSAERERLVADYVREEVLFREARALGLEEGDYVLRQRLVQKMRFLLEIRPQAEPTDAQLAQYLDAHADLYRVEPSWTFTHVFVDPALHGGMQAAGRIARQRLAQLNAGRVPFHEATQHTDRFAFMQNYVERTQDFIDSHFGAAFAQQLVQLAPEPTQWRGPLQSTHGWHLVLVTAHAPGRMPAMAEIRERLRDDLRRDEAARLQDQALQALVGRYAIDVRGLESQ